MKIVKNLSILLCLYFELGFKRMYTLKTVFGITQHVHSCAIHEMYDYDWSKLAICWSIDHIIDTSTWRKLVLLM